MPTFEKRAWLTLGIVAITIATYSLLGMFFKFGMKTSSAFALLALTACFPRKRTMVDERDREILNRSLMVGMGVFWLAFVAGVMVLGFEKGWDTIVPIRMWALSTLIYIAWAVVSSAQSITTIVLYRRGQ